MRSSSCQPSEVFPYFLSPYPYFTSSKFFPSIFPPCVVDPPRIAQFISEVTVTNPTPRVFCIQCGAGGIAPRPRSRRRGASLWSLKWSSGTWEWTLGNSPHSPPPFGHTVDLPAVDHPLRHEVAVEEDVLARLVRLEVLPDHQVTSRRAPRSTDPLLHSPLSIN